MTYGFNYVTIDLTNNEMDLFQRVLIAMSEMNRVVLSNLNVVLWVPLRKGIPTSCRPDYATRWAEVLVPGLVTKNATGAGAEFGGALGGGLGAVAGATGNLRGIHITHRWARVARASLLLVECTYTTVPLALVVISYTFLCKSPSLSSLLFTLEQCRDGLISWKQQIPILLAELGLGFHACFTSLGRISCLLLPRTILLAHKMGNLTIKNFRSAQVFDRVLNSSCRTWLLPTIAVYLPIVNIMAVNDPQRNDVSSAAKIYVASKNRIQDRYKFIWAKPTKLGRKMYKPFRPLRLEFRNNFVERATPLVQEVCARQIFSTVIASN
ncbi:hypothetical protein Fcan01_16546 [Folsomia candida]|uniref:Uncharacterized protein n=1 Tax=Folsomia candida TaxID=158441 RepID=A0A226DUK2_FOLCA|nr:hypothetical protein Fcan01_16546 [Folsomia candida]